MRDQWFSKILPEKTLAFERQRLLNLIDSKVKRKEMESAREFAEELFRKEIHFALLKTTRLLRRCNSAILKIIVALLGVFFVCTASTVLNIRPSFSLAVEAAAVIGIVSAFVVGGLLVKRLEKALRVIMDMYETRRHVFIEMVLTRGGERVNSDDWPGACGPTMAK